MQDEKRTSLTRRIRRMEKHASELGQWLTAHRLADPRLHAYVHGYVGSSSRLRVPVHERHLPSAEVPLLLDFARDNVRVAGLHDRHQLTTAVGEREFMVVRFTPIGAHLFLGLPMHLIANDTVDLELIDPALARALVGRVGAAKSWSDRFAVMESLIAERVADARIPASIGLAWRRLVATDGRIAIGSLASDMTCSHRTLIARFQASVGFPPKTIARVLRFNRAIRSLDRLSGTRADGPAGKPYIEGKLPGDRPIGEIQWADLAADCGYFDQAHFIRDFQAFAGSTPDAFVRHVSFK